MNTTPTPLLRDPNYQPLPGSPWQSFVFDSGGYFAIQASGAFTEPDVRYLYSNLAAWSMSFPFDDGILGTTAFGIATPQGALPKTGRITYTGFLDGPSTETFETGFLGEFNGWLKGSVSLTFDFATGEATISVTPTLQADITRQLAPITNAELVWDRSTTTFHQQVADDPDSLDYPISGRFTGPNGEELIGGLYLTYVAADGTTQKGGAAFIAKRAP